MDKGEVGKDNDVVKNDVVHNHGADNMQLMPCFNCIVSTASRVSSASSQCYGCPNCITFVNGTICINCTLSGCSPVMKRLSDVCCLFLFEQRYSCLVYIF